MVPRVHTSQEAGGQGDSLIEFLRISLLAEERKGREGQGAELEGQMEES